MAYLGQEIDTSQIEPSKPREVIPPGWYKAIIEASDVKPTKDASKAQEYNETNHPKFNDKLLALTFKVVDGEKAGALIFTNLNIVNSSSTAQEIALGDLSAIATAIGKPGARIKDSNELHNRPMMIQVDVEKKEGFNARNIIKGYEPVKDGGGHVPAASASGGAPAQPAWNRR